MNTRNTSINRVKFNPADPAHQRSYYKYLTTQRWGKVQFICEPKYSSVPEMVAHQFAVYALTKELGGNFEEPAEEAATIATN